MKTTKMSRVQEYQAEFRQDRYRVIFWFGGGGEGSLSLDGEGRGCDLGPNFLVQRNFSFLQAERPLARYPEDISCENSRATLPYLGFTFIMSSIIERRSLALSML